MKWLVLGIAAIVVWLIIRASSAKSAPKITSEILPSPQTRPVPQAPKSRGVRFEIEDDLITIDELDLFGPFSRSPNGRFI